MMQPAQAETSSFREQLARAEARAAAAWVRGDLDALLHSISADCTDLWLSSKRLGCIAGSRSLDQLCSMVGRGVADGLTRRQNGARPRRAHAYLVTAIYPDGGHSRLIEDLVAADPEHEHHVLWTAEHPPPGATELAHSIRVDRPPIVHHAGGSPLERITAGMRVLDAIDPDVLVHVGHPNDPVTLALMAGRARARVMMHIADCSFALGRYVDAAHVALGRHFQRAARETIGIATTYLPLTCRFDASTVSPRVHAGASFLTATCGSSHKFEADRGMSYLDLLAVRLTAREGDHLHIGPLTGEQRAQIDRLLDDKGCAGRFHHVEFTPQVSELLRGSGVALYLDSYPVGGGKAIVEAMAAGVPICAASGDPNLDGASFAYPGALRWSKPRDLFDVLSSLDPIVLAEHAHRSRVHFRAHHTFARFAENFAAIVGERQRRPEPIGVHHAG